MFINRLINKGYEAEQCQICQITFSVIKFERIHFCKRCKRYICYRCGPQKAKVIQQDRWSEQPHRICKSCKIDTDKIHKTIKIYQLQWDGNSQISEKWIKGMQIIPKYRKDKINDYSHFRNIFYKNQHNYEEDLDIIEKDVILGRTDYSVFNHSMKQFLFIIQNKYDKTTIRGDIANVLYAIASKYHQIGYCQGMSALIAFLLCFCSQQNCFLIYSDILENIYPNNFFVKEHFGVSLLGLVAQVYFLSQYFIMLLETARHTQLVLNHESYSEQEYLKFKTIIELSSTKCLLSLFTSTLSFSNVFFIFEELQLKHSFEVVEKAFLAIIYLRRKEILNIKSFQVLESYFESIDHKQFIETYNQIQIDQVDRKLILQRFYHNLSDKWTNSSDNNVKALCKVTYFSEDQIKYLQNSFKADQNGVVITKQEFLKFLQIYYRKYQLINEHKIFILDSTYRQYAYNSYNQMNKKGLDFREFVCCLSMTAKSTVKEKLRIIIRSVENKNTPINNQILVKLIQTLYQSATTSLQEEAEQFKKRMDKMLTDQMKVSVNDIHIIINDYFIGSLSLSYSNNSQLLKETISQYMLDKNNFIKNIE